MLRTAGWVHGELWVSTVRLAESVGMASGSRLVLGGTTPPRNTIPQYSVPPDLERKVVGDGQLPMV